MQRAALEKMLDRGQDSALLRVSLAQACLAETDTQSAIKHLQEALALDGDFSAAYKWLGKALQQEGDLEGALKAFEDGAQVAEENGDKQLAKEFAVYAKRIKKAQNDNHD